MYYNQLTKYKQFHSTETALLKVHDDVTLNKGKVTALVNVVWYIRHSPELVFIILNLIDRYQRVKIANCFYSLHCSTQLSYSNL